MNYIGLIALVLGLISVVITIKYVDHYDKLNTILEKKCNNKVIKFPNVLIDIQDNLDLTDKEFIRVINSKKNKIKDILNIKNEKFTNYIPYQNSQKRNLKKTSLSGIITSYISPKKISPFTYIDNKKLAEKAINYQQKYAIFPKYKVLNKNNKKFIERNLCLVKNENKNYCYPTYEKEFCPGIYGKGFNECQKFKFN